MKAHVSLNVTSIERSVDVYRRFFGAEPVKLKADYAKFDLAAPASNLTMNLVMEADVASDGFQGDAVAAEPACCA